MSIKTFHLLFILFSVSLCLITAGWSFKQYQSTNNIAFIGFIFLAIAAACGLGIYGYRFRQKISRLSL